MDNEEIAITAITEIGVSGATIATFFRYGQSIDKHLLCQSQGLL